MLFLTRKIGESIIIDDEITITISEIRGSIVKLSFDYPKTSRILRKEIYDRIQEENKSAASQSSTIKEYLAAGIHKGDVSTKSVPSVQEDKEDQSSRSETELAKRSAS